MKLRRWLAGIAWGGVGMAGALCAAENAELLEKENKVDAARPAAAWTPAEVGQALAVRDRVRTGELSRAAVKLTDLSMLRLDELTKIEILPPARETAKPVLDLSNGAAYFFSREKPRELEIRTPAATGGLRGTEFHVRVSAGGRTEMTMFDGEVELANAAGRIVLVSGEQGVVEPGRAPRKTAVLEAVNIIQWCLYYPGVVVLEDLAFTPEEARVLEPVLAAYRAGDLLGALKVLPATPRASTAGRVLRAAVLLSVGQVEKSTAALAGVPRGHPGRRALERLVAAVKFQEQSLAGEPATASEWLAESYYQQSRSDLESALAAARRATELAPDAGWTWARRAELEFSFGRTPRASEHVRRALQLAPRHAQARALEGFLLAAQNRLTLARHSFDEAIALDGALGNAWLGRGLCAIRRGDEAQGRRDLQTAAVLEPNRSILRSYLGKAFSQVGENGKARSELERAQTLDPRDPTPWLYSAIQKKQENRYNEAIADLERSIALNDNRRVFRSRFLLDQDRSVRGTNLAAIYLNNGMTEQSVREAVRAVGSDYASAPAHLFLANSYNALRDPTRILLRYETAWLNELLLANLLSPVGGGPLSQYVSEQEYSKLFERDGLGLSSLSQYFSFGELRQTASQYGTFGNFSYALDAEYQYNDGLRPNNAIDRLETYANFKVQLGPQDTLFFQTKFQRLEQGNILQLYDQKSIGRETSTEVRDANGKLRRVVRKNTAELTTDFRETQDPALLLAGWRHEWTPGNHTLLLVGRLANDQVLTAEDTSQAIVTRDVTRRFPAGLRIDRDRAGSDRPLSDGDLRALLRERAGTGTIERFSSGSFDSDYRANFETYTAELSQILTLEPQTFVFGGRYQSGQFETRVRLDNFADGRNPAAERLFKNPPALQAAVVDFERINLYLYDLWKVTSWLEITAGVTYDSLKYPENFRSTPVSERQLSLDAVSPKVGLTLTPWRGATIRGAYAEAISGASFDESIRLEPTQVNGFVQAYRSVISESEIGAVGGSSYKFLGGSLEQKLPTRTYLGVEYNLLQQDLERTVGVFDAMTVNGEFLGIIPSSLREKDAYREDILTATVNQLVGDCWAGGTRYRYTRSQFRQQFGALEDALDRASAGALDDIARNADRRRESGLHEISLYTLFNHPSGFFARAEANWFRQANDRRVTTAILPTVAGAPVRLRTENLGNPGDDFWHVNLYAGYRFYRNQCELSCGLLNLTGADYQLEPLNPYVEMPRDRTLLVRVRFAF